MRHFEENSILTDNQHGFRRGRSCEIQLLELVEELTTTLESGKQADVLIVDFSKAFDKVNHSLLLHKLQRYGVQGTTNTWIANFLNNRRQAAVVSSASSHFVNVGAGIAQWLECWTRDRKVAGSNTCWSGGRIFFSRIIFMC